MSKTNQFKLVLITPFFILLSHYLAVFPHEYAHSFAAWILGHKANPFALSYGGTSWNNLLLLGHIDENVDYHSIQSLGQGFHMFLIAFAGPGIANGLLFIGSLFLLKKYSIQRQPYLYYFVFWFNLMNLGNFYDYVPIRTFASHGDIAHMTAGLGVSPWCIYIIFGYLVGFLIWHFFTKTLMAMFINLRIDTNMARASLMITCVGILFGFFGGIIGVFLSSKPMPYGEISYFLSVTSFLMIPGIIVALWPTRNWVECRLKQIRSAARFVQNA
jgi:hypothetical protein